MLFHKQEGKNKSVIREYIKSKTFHRILIGLITFILALVIIEVGAGYQKYDIQVLTQSKYDIDAPRDVEDRLRTIEDANNAKNSIKPIYKEINSASIDVLNKVDDLFNLIENSRSGIEKSLQGLTKFTNDYNTRLASEQELEAVKLYNEIKKQNIFLSKEQVRYLIKDLSEKKLKDFQTLAKSLISDILKNDITNENLPNMYNQIQNQFQKKETDQELVIIGGLVSRGVLKPNKEIDDELTDILRQEAYNKVMNSNKTIIRKGDRIISKSETVTVEKYEILKNLRLLKVSDFDYEFFFGILLILLLLAAMLVLYLNNFCRKILYDTRNLLILCIVMLLVLLVGRIIGGYSVLYIPILIAPMLISILLDIRTAIIVNIILTVIISAVVGGDIGFITVSIISGTYAPFLVGKIPERSKILMIGAILGFTNALVILGIGLINKYTSDQILADCGIIALNGVVCTILTIGLLPFFESIFNVTTPSKLLELSNPNQPLIKRLLMEAPGTYHHSLMVGNLAEVACEAIGANAMLARVGSYYHDIGKLKRPNFFKENQLSENPHDKMTPNLSTLVITSHTQDGVEIAEKYKLPLAIREIIGQHHGTTLVAYFFHKAKKSEKVDPIKHRDFRYTGPKPTTNESAIVMLADTAEAAVRSMPDKSEGKIEGLVRKLIKEKLDDGQLNHCNLTLKDLDDIVIAFTTVFNGLYHEREEYPNIDDEFKNKENKQETEKAKQVKPAKQIRKQVKEVKKIKEEKAEKDEDTD
ncbi:MAG: HDIG domain-containing metalloprotein [Clostridia bacterium]|jgi:hypothetical protein